MKKYFTLLFLFLICLTVLAKIHHAGLVKSRVHGSVKAFLDTVRKDSSKAHSTVNNDNPPAPRSLNSSESLKLFTSAVHKDSLKFQVSSHNSDSLNLFAMIFQKGISKQTNAIQAPAPPATPTVNNDTLRAPILLHNSESLKLFSSTTHKESLKSFASTNSSDSLKLFTSMLTDDSNLKMLTEANQKNGLNLALLAQHADSLTSESREQIKSVNRDSLRLIAMLLRQDTLRSPVYAHLVDSLKQRLKTLTLDSLKLELHHTSSDLFKGPIYSEIAVRYLDYDTLSNKRKRQNYQNEAINYTMQALHRYSLYNDTLGLRSCFDNLTKVYTAQNKFSQAKWFVLQSNALSRAKNDVPSIISSLITLSAIKANISDYTLAMRDLNEALQLSEKYKLPKAESEVLRNYALLYSRLQNYDKEAIVLKKRDSIEDAMHKDEEARLLAKDASQLKKVDSLQTKKKVFSSNIKKPSKSSSAKKTVSL